jgi:hypothetical protein
MLSAYGISSLAMCTLNYSSPSSVIQNVEFFFYLTNERPICQGLSPLSVSQVFWNPSLPLFFQSERRTLHGQIYLSDGVLVRKKQQKITFPINIAKNAINAFLAFEHLGALNRILKPAQKM